jgi:hypothetical protein
MEAEAMDAQRIIDIIEELRLLARAQPTQKPLLHRAARALEDHLPAAEKKVARGRYGGRAMPPPFAKPAERQFETVQIDLL